MLELQHVVKSYGDKTALKDFSLKLDNGLFGLLGENGAGKSTLMSVLFHPDKDTDLQSGA